MPDIVIAETPSLGDRSYLMHDGEVAIVVDPMRDHQRLLDLARGHDVRITDIFETHIHNDYVTGGLALAEASGAAYHVNAEDPVRFSRSPIRDGEVIEAGAMAVRALATPGHTFTHLSYVVGDGASDLAVFSGGSLLFGTTGRPDLLGEEHAEELARLQHASVHRIAADVDDTADVFPTHGFGSFCAATSSEATASTVGGERISNSALTTPVEEWVRETLAALGPFPAYYAHMGPANLGGPAAPDLRPPEAASPGQIAEALGAGQWVVDLRTRQAWAAGHVRRSVNIGLDGQFSTYVGWLKPWEAPVILLGDSQGQIAQAQVELARIGIDQVSAAAAGSPADWTVAAPPARMRRAGFAELQRVREERVVAVLDVRQRSEHDRAAIPGAVNIPVQEIATRDTDAPDGELWVHCETGYRAAIAASVLAGRGREVVLVDDNFDAAIETGLADSSA